MPNNYRPDYRRKDDKTNWALYIFLFFMFGGGIVSSIVGLIGALMPVLIIGVVFYFIFGQNKNRSTTGYSPSRDATQRSYKTNAYQSRYRTTNRGTYGRTKAYRPTYSKKDIDLVDEKLAHYFDKNEKLDVVNDINLRLKSTAYISLKSLNVYMKDDYVCSLEEFGNRYIDIYDQIIRWLINFANNKDTSEIFDAQPSYKREEQKAEANVDSFIKQINDLNIEIPDEDISNGLYETSAFLKQIGEIESKFPGKSEKLSKLYKYYLPMLINNLNQYKELQTAQTHENFESTKEKLNKNVILVNEAMKTLAASLCEEDFINLSADISTLESLLKKDGLAGDQRMSQFKGGGSSE